MRMADKRRVIDALPGTGQLTASVAACSHGEFFAGDCNRQGSLGNLLTARMRQGESVLK